MPFFQTQSIPRSSDRFDETVPYSQGVDAQDMEDGPTLAVPPCQWLATASAFADTGGLVSADELAELLRQNSDLSWPAHTPQPAALVAHWVVSNVVVTIDSPWGRMLPLFQFDLPRGVVHPCMRPLLSELHGVFDDAELALWFITPNDWLDGRRPAHAMHDDLPAVRLAARTDRYVALGG
jgi:hypothetical protein